MNKDREDPRKRKLKEKTRKSRLQNVANIFNSPLTNNIILAVDTKKGGKGGKKEEVVEEKKPERPLPK